MEEDVFRAGKLSVFRVLGVPAATVQLWESSDNCTDAAGTPTCQKLSLRVADVLFLMSEIFDLIAFRMCPLFCFSL